VKGYPDRRFRAAVVAIARAAFAGDEERLGAAVAKAIAVVPIRDCDGCGMPYLQADGRQRRFCSARCCYRIAQRERRRRARVAAVPPKAAV
jgi:predicted nucleic acid-binding Zn ribbon protein